MSFPGYGKPASWLIDVGLIGLGAVGSVVVFSATKGGVTFDPGIQYRHIEADGISTEFEGGHRIVKYDSHLKTKLKNLPSTMIKALLPGSTQATVSSVTTTTPKAARALLTIGPSGHYIEDLWFIGNRSDGILAEVHIPRALPKFSIATTDNNEGDIDVDFMAVLTDAQALNEAPFTIREAAAA